MSAFRLGLLFRSLSLVVLLAAQSALSQEAAAPFVAGFDRFARHGDIEPIVGGRLLLSELSCTACHSTTHRDLQPKRGPRLDGIGNRVQHQWLRRFIAAPHSVKPGTTMPEVLGSLSKGEKERVADALSAFLSSQRKPFPEVKATGANPVPHQFWTKGNRERGQQLYHQIGCVACHEADEEYEGGEAKTTGLDRLLEQLDPEEIEEMGLSSAVRPVRSVPHGELATKYTRQSLTFFLMNPELSRPSGRMPSLKLKPVEAADLAAYLLRNQTGEVDGANSHGESLVEEGKRLFRELQCHHCHSVGESRPASTAKPLAELVFDAKKSCVDDAKNGLPHFSLDKEQIKSIQLALADLKKPKGTARSQAEFALLQMNCYACHERDKRGGVGRNRQRYFEVVGHVDLGDEGRIPPPLTGVGRKLHKSWFNKVLGGTGDVRPHMIARMPKFPTTSVAALPDLLSRADGAKQPSEKEVFPKQTGLAAAGRTLLDTGCVQCHALGGERMPGVVGVELAGIASRVQPQWFHDFLRDPVQLKDRTRMPTFFPKGKSTSPSVLHGDVEQQIAAMWAYLKEVDKHPLPDKIAQARSQDFELVPKDRPILLRTFMDQAGTHAIAVGFPEKIHFAFDAEGIRLAQAWRGGFVDAYGTWFVRFAPPADPLGGDLKTMPSGVPFALLTSKDQAWPSAAADEIGYRFSGYRFDREGVPTFLYRFGQFEIEDRIEPGSDRGLKRRLRIKRRHPGKAKSRLWFRAINGKTLARRKPNGYANEHGLIVAVSMVKDRHAEVRNMNGNSEWLLRLDVDDEATIKVHCQWK